MFVIIAARLTELRSKNVKQLKMQQEKDQNMNQGRGPNPKRLGLIDFLINVAFFALIAWIISKALE